MIKYAKIIDDKTKEANVGLGNNNVYYAKLGMQLLDVEETSIGTWYLMGFAPIEPEEVENEENIDSSNINSDSNSDFGE